MAGGEMLLNGRELTEAAIKYVWVGDSLSSLISTLRSDYAESHGGEDLMAATGGDVTEATLEELRSLTRRKVGERLHDFTVVDAVVALQAYGRYDLQGKLAEAFRHTASLQSLLAPYHTKTLKAQNFAAVVYAPSSLPESNTLFDRILEEIKGTLQIKVETSHDQYDSECLLFFCEFFCIPLRSLNMYVESIADFDQVMDEPRYCPHPEIYH